MYLNASFLQHHPNINTKNQYLSRLKQNGVTGEKNSDIMSSETCKCSTSSERKSDGENTEHEFRLSHPD